MMPVTLVLSVAFYDDWSRGHEEIYVIGLIVKYVDVADPDWGFDPVFL